MTKKIADQKGMTPPILLRVIRMRRIKETLRRINNLQKILKGERYTK